MTPKPPLSQWALYHCFVALNVHMFCVSSKNSVSVLPVWYPRKPNKRGEILRNETGRDGAPAAMGQLRVFAPLGCTSPPQRMHDLWCTSLGHIACWEVWATVPPKKSWLSHCLQSATYPTAHSCSCSLMCPSGMAHTWAGTSPFLGKIYKVTT